jgi:hypothetical protein
VQELPSIVQLPLLPPEHVKYEEISALFCYVNFYSYRKSDVVDPE